MEMQKESHVFFDTVRNGCEVTPVLLFEFSVEYLFLNICHSRFSYIYVDDLHINKHSKKLSS